MKQILTLLYFRTSLSLMEKMFQIFYSFVKYQLHEITYLPNK